MVVVGPGVCVGDDGDRGELEELRIREIREFSRPLPSVDMVRNYIGPLVLWISWNRRQVNFSRNDPTKGVARPGNHCDQWM